MSQTVVRGKPTEAQLYLDTVLDAILTEQGVKPDPTQRANVTLPQIMLHCLKERPKDVFMINGATGEEITNEYLLKQTVSLARAFTAKGARGKYAMLLMRNHQDMTSVYFASMFVGMIPFMMDPNTTPYELTHFLKLIEPSFVFYDQEFHDTLQAARQECEHLNTSVLMVDKPGVLQQFTDGFNDEVDSYQVSPVSVDDPVMLLPTSGSTGIPKAAIMTHRGLITNLPTPWSYHTQFPTPTSRVMVLTTIQWVTFTMFLTSSVTHHIPIIMTPKKITVEHVAEMIEKYRPTFTYLTPAFTVSFVNFIRPDQLSSLQTLILLGSPATPELMASLQEKLPKNCHLCNGYGTTEAHGFIALPDREAPLNCNGRVFNYMYYKVVKIDGTFQIIDDEGQQLGLNQTGELCIKGTCVIKGYHKKDMADDESFSPDGWYKTGDVFYLDDNERLTFVIRKKFSFKFMGGQVAPEEVERVISSVPGVHESVVCLSEDGPVAAVVLDPLADVTREQIHKAVDTTLSDHKRLHGGIAFVTSLPHTHSGKLQRTKCIQLIEELRKNGECY